MLLWPLETRWLLFTQRNLQNLHDNIPSSVGRRILNTHWTEFVTNDEVCSLTGQPLLSPTRQIGLLSEVVACPYVAILTEPFSCQNHYRDLQACVANLFSDWRRSSGRPKQPCLRTVETDRRASTESWRRHNDAHTTGRHGGNSWQR